jgi:phosphoglycolate phosphatase
MKNTIIFDLDGTLVDSAKICTYILNSMLVDRGSDRIVTIDDAKPHLSRGGTAMVAALLGEHCGDEQEAISDFRGRYAQLPTPLDSLYDGVRDGLERLAAQELRMAICSNKPQNLCEKVLEDLDLGDLFDVVIGTGPGRRPKPDCHLLELTLAELGARPEECLFIGDSEIDAATAARMNIPFLFLTYGYASPEWCTADLHRFDRFADLVTNVNARVGGLRQLPKVA